MAACVQVEFILMGGTFMSLPTDYRDYFVRNLHDALSGHASSSVAEAVRGCGARVRAGRATGSGRRHRRHPGCLHRVCAQKLSALGLLSWVRGGVGGWRAVAGAVQRGVADAVHRADD